MSAKIREGPTLWGVGGKFAILGLGPTVRNDFTEAKVTNIKKALNLHFWGGSNNKRGSALARWGEKVTIFHSLPPSLVYQPVQDRYRPGWLVEHHYDPNDFYRPEGGVGGQGKKKSACGVLKSEDHL